MSEMVAYKCEECGKPCGPREFHPYAACVAWRDGYKMDTGTEAFTVHKEQRRARKRGGE